MGLVPASYPAEGAPERSFKRGETHAKIRNCTAVEVAGGALAFFAGVALTALASAPAAAQSKQLTLCWAAWDPANALVELGKDFTKEPASR